MTITACLDRISGFFEPKELSNNPVLSDIYLSLNKLEYYGRVHDKINLKNDVSNLHKDFRKVIEEAKSK